MGLLSELITAVLNFFDQPWFRQWLSKSEDLITLAERHRRGEVVHHSQKRLNAIWNWAKRQGFSLDRPPLVKDGVVVDGNHRIAYCLVRNMPCFVRVIE